jgi:hypothetical protein
MKKAFLFLATTFCMSLYAQNTDAPATYFLTLNNGKVITSPNLRYEDSYTKEGFLIVDNKEQYNLRDVKDYQIRDGYFKKMASSEIFNGQQIWYKQEDPGRIKVYSQLKTRYVPNVDYTGQNSYVPLGGQFVTKKHFYYQFGDQGPKKFKYADLLPLVQSDPKSLKMLQKGYGLAWLKASLYIVGTAFLIKGLSYGCNEKEVGCAERSKKGTGWAVAGLTLPLVALLVPRSEVKYRESVYLFNKD